MNKKIFVIIAFSLCTYAFAQSYREDFPHSFILPQLTEEVKAINLSSDDHLRIKVQAKNTKGNFFSIGYIILDGFGDTDHATTVGGIDWTTVGEINIIFMKTDHDYYVSTIKDGSDIVLVIEDTVKGTLIKMPTSKE